ncbi:MAG: family 10 glycosylhydrolase [Muribaculaceae bacterium]|nr:family 10 glycosylhydrolase [Muribaculaceae bacterium]
MPRFSANNPLRRIIISATFCVLWLTAAHPSAPGPKRDFRGAWIQTVFQEQYQRRNSSQNQSELKAMLDRLHRAGINAVIFQVRPSADAFFISEIEPWSRHLTGRNGTAPQPLWDPLQFMIDECHARGMELHAWINPYRVTASPNEKLPDNHFTKQHPERYVTFNRRLYFNPALEENRHHIVEVVTDIVTRYDVDGIHFDDYFYPYPNGAEKFADHKHYRESGSKLTLGDWRRQNVDKLIEQVHTAISTVKPWVRFGISPFGIWRNKTSDKRGSETSGLQNYDDLYADVPSWAEKGWIDYQIPQLYWEIDHRRASYRTLCAWWAENGRGRHVYIGQDVKKTADAGELADKLAMTAQADEIQGNCWWYAGNIDAISEKLRAGAYSKPALVPEYLWLHVEPADKPSDPTFSNGRLHWKKTPDARKWVIYRFDDPEMIDIDDPGAIVGITYSPEFTPTTSGYYVITALDYANGESAPAMPVYIP